jgi:very-short-patch-repair endonuclease
MRHPFRDLARKLRKDMTDTERFVWCKIRKKQLAGFRFRRQKPVGPFIVDFVCVEARLVLELDGGQHAVQKEEDAARTRWLEENGYRVLRFWNIDVFKEWESVEAVIVNALMEASAKPPTPTLPP